MEKQDTWKGRQIEQKEAHNETKKRVGEGKNSKKAFQKKKGSKKRFSKYKEIFVKKGAKTKNKME